jgi:hypothetical protein
MQLKIFFYFELLSLIVCLMTFYKLRHTYLKWFLPYLLFIVLYEYGCIVKWSFFFINKSNHWLANIVTIVEISFFSALYFHYIKSKKTKKIILWGYLLYLVGLIVNFLFFQSFSQFNTITYRIGTLLIVTWVLLYFQELMAETSDRPLIRQPMFWISVGLLFFYLGFFFYLSAFDFVAHNSLEKYKQLYKIIRYTIIIQLYILFSIGFLCTPKRRR